MNHHLNKVKLYLKKTKLSLNSPIACFSLSGFVKLGKLPENSGFVPDGTGGVYRGTGYVKNSRLRMISR